MNCTRCYSKDKTITEATFVVTGASLCQECADHIFKRMDEIGKERESKIITPKVC